MATRKRASPPKAADEVPSTEEIGAAITAWRMTWDAYVAAEDKEQEARTALVDVLRRAGLKGLEL